MLINEFEKKIVENVLAGDHEELSEVRLQISDLMVLKREGAEQFILVEFDVDNGYRNGINDNLNFEVTDTRFINEFGEVFFIKLTVLKGVIRYLTIGGPYDFTKDMPNIYEFFWCSKFKSKYLEEDKIKQPAQRNFRTAIGYIPSYK